MLSACSSTHTSSSTTTVTGSTVATTTSTTAGTATTTTVAGGCAAAGDLAAKHAADPLLMSGLTGADIRVGRHPCFERLVIELRGTGAFPGWTAEYVDDPVRLGESDEFTSIAGSATLLVRMGMWMQTMEGEGYQGATDLFPTTVDHVLEMRLTENWEGMSIWAIGLDTALPFTVTVLHTPERLVIDFSTDTVTHKT